MEKEDEIERSEPAISTDAAEEIRDALGNALAPTYLPEGLRFIEGGVREITLPPQAPEEFDVPTYVDLGYWTGPEEPNRHGLRMSYTSRRPLGRGSLPGLEAPEDAISATAVHGNAASLIRGFWSLEAMYAYTETGELPADAEWDYNASMALEFAFDLADGSTVAITLVVSPVPAEWTGLEQLVRIAESIEVVD